MSDQKSFEDKWDNEIERWTPRRVKVWIAVLVLVCMFGGIAVWAFTVATSNTKGAGDAVIQKNTALNRTQAQALFNTNFQSIKSLDQKLTDAQKTLDDFNKTHPSVGNGTPFDPQAEQQANYQRTVTGLQQQCHNAVADYNAATRTYTLEDFRDTDLPKSIDASDPAFTSGANSFTDFDCKASA